MFKPRIFLVQALNGFITLHDGFKAGPSLIVRLLIDLHILVKDRNNSTFHPIEFSNSKLQPVFVTKRTSRLSIGMGKPPGIIMALISINKDGRLSVCVEDLYEISFYFSFLNIPLISKGWQKRLIPKGEKPSSFVTIM